MHNYRDAKFRMRYARIYWLNVDLTIAVKILISSRQSLIMD